MEDLYAKCGSAGGVPILQALKHYVTALVDTFGETDYAGRARYKGEAYVRFSKADMGVLLREDRVDGYPHHGST
jgi:hypothetical protein